MASLIYTAEQLSTLPFLEEIDLLKKEADSYKPLPKESEDRVLQKFRLDWNYHSNAIEGNKLTYGETVAFIMEGVTAKGKTLKDHLDIKGHDEAVKYLIHIVKDDGYLLNEVDIKNLHKVILKEPYWNKAITPGGEPTQKEVELGKYKSESNSVRTATGEMHYYATPIDTPILMGELMEFYHQAKINQSVHPLVLATLFHHQFTSIHPFDDGNGRMARLLMNLMLMQAGYPPIVIKQDDRTSYYQVLRQADAGETIPIVEYMGGLLRHSLNVYISGAKGESIEEEDDIDKEIALFVKGLEEDKVSSKKSEVLVEKALKDSIVPLFNFLFGKFNQLNDLFIEIVRTMTLQGNQYITEFEIGSSGLIDIDKIFLNINHSPIFETPKFSPWSDYNISLFNIKVSFNGFKKVMPSISFGLKYIIRFDEFDYSVFRDGSQKYLLQEAYNRTVSKELIIGACNEEIKAFLETLKRYSP